MSDDLLRRATRALADEITPERHARTAELRRGRLERALREKERGRGRFRTGTLLLAAAFLTFATWAAASGRLQHWLRLGLTSEPALPPASSVQVETRPARGVPALIPSAVESAAPADTASEPDASVVEEPSLGNVRAHSTAAATRSSAPPSPSAANSNTGARGEIPTASSASAPDLDALYRAAHTAHFVQNDPALALAAWDRYLAAAGANGRMTLEARYNRAIALVRLGRTEEARRALLPFARGEYGGYRRDDAARLLESLH